MSNINSSNPMYVIKRNNKQEKVSFDKILKRITNLCKKLKLNRIDSYKIAKETINGLYDGITTEEIDHYAAVNCSEKIRDDPQYDKLATGLCISRVHKITDEDYLNVVNQLYHLTLVTEDFHYFVHRNINIIQQYLYKTRHKDYELDYFGFKTLERAYLHKNKTSTKEIIIERPQYLWMRVAIGLNLDSIDDVIETYVGLVNRQFIFGSPTLFNAGSTWNQMSSCFLLNIKDDLENILDIIKEVGLISKRAGGIGLCVSNIRANGSLIRGTNGKSNGIVPMIQVFNWLGRYINQGGRRRGAIALYIEPWHADIYHFCELRSNKGAEEERARDIFLALWICDLFMKRVKEDSYWSLMCPDECPGLTTTYGKEFEELYIGYENSKKYKQQIKARDLWIHILSMQIETGMPYMLFKDNVNHKTNHQNLGVIQCSNLCSEIVEYTDEYETAVCNLSSICLPRFVKNDKSFDFKSLLKTTKIITKNLNKVIDINYYPSKKAEYSNSKNRPIGIGVQGLADVFCKMNLAYDSEEARILNKKIFETIYFGALTTSTLLAKQFGKYKSFDNSPFSKGILQYHMWGLTEDDLVMDYDWKHLIEHIKEYGTRNSLLTTIMPTASTSQIMGNTESIEPLTSNIYTRSTMSGEYTVINKNLIETLIELNLWNDQLKNEILYDKGSIQQIVEIPEEIKKIYKTAYEIKNKPIVQQSIDRGPFIDQSQSLNLFCLVPDFNNLTSSHFYSWSNGLKTGLYYLKTQPAVSALDFGIDKEIINEIETKRGLKQQTETKPAFYITPPCNSGSCGG